MAKKATTKPVKRGRPAKAKDEKPAEATVDRDMQALARHHVAKYVPLKEALNTAQRKLQSFGKIVKADGLTMGQIKLMVQLQTPEGEAALHASIMQDLQAAQWQGAKIGAQLSLFEDFVDRTPSTDVAYEQGVQDCMDGKTAKPKYAPDLPQHASYMKGYHDETERRVKSGIKAGGEGDNGSKLIKKADKDASVKAAADRAAARSSSATAAARPSSGTPMTRAEYQKQQRDARAQNRAEAEALFDKGAPPVH